MSFDPQMPPIQLYLGYPVSPQLLAEMHSTNPEMLRQFTHGGAYLQEIHFQGTTYLAKPVDPHPTLATLDLLEMNIYSLLQKLSSRFPFHQTPMILFAKV